MRRRPPARGASAASAFVAVIAASGVGAACAGPAAEPQAIRTSLQVAGLLGGADTLHERATDVRAFDFPADHGAHPAFRTEWWYFTGNLVAADGRELGYQLTFFRSALTDSATFLAGLPDAEASAWRSRHAWMAHFAVSDIGAARMHAAERFARGGLELAGADADPFRVWLGSWQAEAGAGSFFPLRITAAHGDVAIDLVLDAGKPMVLQGERGLSRKGPEPGNASYYYSFTRMPTTGTVTIGDEVHRVAGASWLDREWSTSVLTADVEGWDWMALRLDDGTELMLYRLRRADGSPAPLSAGTFVDRDGAATALDATMFTMTPVRSWRSPLDGTAYPTAWRVAVPSLGVQLDVEAAFDAQELDLAVRYWEGAVRIRGARGAAPVQGRGYLEMTGWAATPATPATRAAPDR